MTIPKTLTVKQVMAKTGFPRSYVYRLVRRGDWASIKVDGAQTATIRIIESSVEAWFDRQLEAQRVPRARALDVNADLPPVEQPAFA